MLAWLAVTPQARIGRFATPPRSAPSRLGSLDKARRTSTPAIPCTTIRRRVRQMLCSPTFNSTSFAFASLSSVRTGGVRRRCRGTPDGRSSAGADWEIDTNAPRHMMMP
jgi:hypothetical protein